MKNLKKWWAGAMMLLLCMAVLSGCSLAGFLLSGCGGGEADLVVINGSSLMVAAVDLSCGDWSETVGAPKGGVLLERGESYGLELEEGTEQITVTLYGGDGRTLAQRQVTYEGRRLYLTLEEGQRLSCSETWPEGLE